MNSEKFYLKNDINAIIEKISPESKKLNKKKFLITGANGFLGKYFIACLLELNKVLKNKIKIYAIDIQFDNCELFNDKFVKCIKKDINTFKVIKTKCDYILHLAGIPSPKNYHDKPIETLLTSIIGTKTLLDLAKKNKAKFVFFSSSEIYGNPDRLNIPTKETYNGNVSTLGDRACYDEGKRVGETLAFFYKKKFNVEINIFRPFNIIGPGMKKSDYRVFPNFFSAIKNNNPLNIFRDGKQTRTFCYIVDAMIFMFLIIIKGKNIVYNIGINKPEITMKNLAKKIQYLVPKKVKIRFKNYPKKYPQTEPLRRCPVISRLVKEFKFKQFTKIEDSIMNFYKWSQRYY
jgi:UDP-glucuronate decarboxylase